MEPLKFQVSERYLKICDVHGRDKDLTLGGRERP